MAADRPILEPIPDDWLEPRPRVGATFTTLVGQLVADTRGLDDAIERGRRPIADLAGGDPDAALSPHEAAVIASQQADRATLRDLYVVDAALAVDALDTRTDDGLRRAVDVNGAHDGLAPRIDEGAGQIPVEPDKPPPVLSPNPKDWKTPDRG